MSYTTYGLTIAYPVLTLHTTQQCRSWCKYLKSVEYIGFVNEETDENMSLRQSKWTVSVKGLRFR